MVADCKRAAGQLEQLTEVVAVTTYEAVLVPPLRITPPFDVIVLIRTSSPDDLGAVQETGAYRGLPSGFVMAARNARRIGDTDHPRSGMYLFNHFAAADADSALRTWDDIAGWFTTHAGVDDSTLLRPTHDSPYVFVNHVRLPCSPLRFLLRLAKPSFRSSVSRRLKVDRIDFGPVVCRVV